MRNQSFSPSTYTKLTFQILLSIFIAKGFGQSATGSHLLSPHYSDRYKSHQILPDGTIRVFSFSAQDYTIEYTDIGPGKSIDSIRPVSIEVPGSHYWYWTPFDFRIIHLKDGASILINITPHCDVAATGAIVLLNKDGEVEWSWEQEDDHTLQYIEPAYIVFTDSNKVTLIDRFGKDIEVDLDNRSVEIKDVQPQYQFTIQDEAGFIATRGDSLFVLGTNFIAEASYGLSGSIEYVRQHYIDEYIIKTTDRYYRLYSDRTLVPLTFNATDVKSVWYDESHYYISKTGSSAVVRLDQQFTPLDSQAIPPGMDPLMGTAIADSLYVIARLDNSIDTGLVVFKSSNDNFNLSLQHDIGITSLDIQDSVFAYYLPIAIFGTGWYHFYEYVEVEVTNFGVDTIKTYIIKDGDNEECYECASVFNFWQITNMPIPPGESVSVSLGTYEPMCQSSGTGQLCLSAIAPDDEADADFTNNRFCQMFSSILSEEHPEATIPVRIYPNPSSDKLFIELDEINAADLRLTIINATGQWIEQTALSQLTEVEVMQYPPGLYLANISGNQKSILKTFVVQH